MLQKVSDSANGTPAWPNMHEALMELHEILHDWCQAAKNTSEALQRLETHHLTSRATRLISGPNNAGTPVRVPLLKIPLKPGYVEAARRDIEGIMRSAAPLAQRWSSAKRRQAARRSLLGLMRLYCADLLDEFENAVDARTSWIVSHRDEINKALQEGILLPSLEYLIRESSNTAAQLESAREHLNRLIREHYPMGSTSG
ncbi:hypothetical protein [Streptomyces sp. SCL15-6]|uniref:hypothetical protein n=1 Tax=Streptomyces sp. SCL15-6 TaxID=2967222 RepID=UPI0029671578|nr:hypothetical protein [Streptomyces sp. SCL15-6]